MLLTTPVYAALTQSIEFQRLGKLMGGSALIGTGRLGLRGDIFGESDQLLPALPIIGSIFSLKRW